MRLAVVTRLLVLQPCPRGTGSRVPGAAGAVSPHRAWGSRARGQSVPGTRAVCPRHQGSAAEQVQIEKGSGSGPLRCTDGLWFCTAE